MSNRNPFTGYLSRRSVLRGGFAVRRGEPVDCLTGECAATDIVAVLAGGDALRSHGWPPEGGGVIVYNVTNRFVRLAPVLKLVAGVKAL